MAGPRLGGRKLPPVGNRHRPHSNIYISIFTYDIYIDNVRVLSFTAPGYGQYVF